MSKEFSNVNPNMLSLAEIREEAYQQGRADREIEIVENIKSYIQMLIKAMNDKSENPTLHKALADIRATEVRVRMDILEQLKEQKNEEIRNTIQGQ